MRIASRCKLDVALSMARAQEVDGEHWMVGPQNAQGPATRFARCLGIGQRLSHVLLGVPLFLNRPSGVEFFECGQIGRKQLARHRPGHQYFLQLAAIVGQHVLADPLQGGEPDARIGVAQRFPQQPSWRPRSVAQHQQRGQVAAAAARRETSKSPSTTLSRPIAKRAAWAMKGSSSSRRSKIGQMVGAGPAQRRGANFRRLVGTSIATGPTSVHARLTIDQAYWADSTGWALRPQKVDDRVRTAGCSQSSHRRRADAGALGLVGHDPREQVRRQRVGSEIELLRPRFAADGAGRRIRGCDRGGSRFRGRPL